MSSEAIGQQLRQAREARSLTLEQVSHTTRMRLRYLQALEVGDFDALPSTAQARGFLRTYAGFLDLDVGKLLEGYETPSPAPVPPTPASVRPSDSIPGDREQADAIFVEVGQQLQHQRELLGLSLDDVVRHTHLRRHYLAALETGDIQDMPSPVQGRGMLNNYAVFLGLDPDPLLLRFADGLQARLAARQVSRTESKPAPVVRRKRALPPLLRRLFSSDILIGVTLTLFLVGFVFWGAIRIFAMRSDEEPLPTAPSIADVLLASPIPSTTPTPELVSQTTSQVAPQAVAEQETEGQQATVPPETVEMTPESTVPAESQAGVNVYITVYQRAWMRVVVDDKTEFEGRVLPGSAYNFSGEERVELLTGNGAALQVFFNQQDLGLLGLFGQVVNRVYTVEGAMAPTPTVTPTATQTPRPSPTPRSAGTVGPGTPAVPVSP